MSSSCIKMERLWSDVHCIELKITARCIDIQSALNIYLGEDYLKDLKNKLVSFPTDKEDIIEWEIGSKKGNSSGYFRFKAFIYDELGHVAIEVEMDNMCKSPYSLKSHFYILTEISSLNDFGRKIDKLLIDDGAVIEGIIHSM